MLMPGKSEETTLSINRKENRKILNNTWKYVERRKQNKKKRTKEVRKRKKKDRES